MNGDFTLREQEVIRLMCEGNLCAKEIAARLNISADTVKAHQCNLYNKLREKLGRSDINRVDVVIYAIVAGFADQRVLRQKYAVPDERLSACSPL